MKEKNENLLQKIWRILYSMKLGIILLLAIGVLSILGTVIPQGNSLQFYESNYSPIIYELITSFSLYKVYSSWWFLALVSILSLNLIFCSIRRFKKIVISAFKKSNIELELKSLKNWQNISVKQSDAANIFRKMKFKSIHEVTLDDGKLFYSDKNNIGYLGSWLTHLGLLIVIIFFAYGKINGFEAFVHGVPGVNAQIEGTNFSITIDDFNILYREDQTVEQYISEIRILEDENVIDSGEVLVNHPFRTNNMNIYQNGTGWSVKTKLYKDGEEYKSDRLYQGEFFIEDNQKIALQFVNFYPDLDENSEELRNKSPFPNHPVMLYAIFYEGYRVDMNLVHMGEEIEFEEYRFIIDEPQEFTILQIVRDPGTFGAAIGGLILVIGIFLAVLVNPKKLRVHVDHKGRVKIYGKSYKSNPLFQEELNTAIDSIRR